MKPGIDLPDDRRFLVEEVSAGVYRASGTDRHGRRCEATGEGPEIALAQCQATAGTLDAGHHPVPWRRDFTSAAQLESFVAELHGMLEAGTLAPIPGPNGIDDHAVAAIVRGGAWPGVIDAEFLDRAGQRYCLSVDTFHGQGGRWRRLPAGAGLIKT